MAKEAKEKKTQKKWEKYSVEGDTVKRNNKTCPKCGPGIFLAEHKDRYACGKCGYMEKKPSGPKPEPPKEEAKPAPPKAEAPKAEAAPKEAPKAD